MNKCNKCYKADKERCSKYKYWNDELRKAILKQKKFKQRLKMLKKENASLMKEVTNKEGDVDGKKR